MPESGAKELVIGPLFRNSSDSLTSIPIKKRPFVVAKIPSSPSQTPSSPPEDYGTLQKKHKVSGTKFSDLGSDAEPAIEATSIKGQHLRSFVEESNINRDVSLTPRHVSMVDQNEVKFGGTIGGGTDAYKGTGGISQADVSDLGLVKENTDWLSSQMETDDGKSVLYDNHASLRVAAITEVQSGHRWSSGQPRHGLEITGTKLHPPLMDSFGLPRNGGSGDMCTVEKEKLDQELSRSEGHDGLQSDRSIDPANSCAKRFNWDLNTVVDSWEGSTWGITTNREAHEWLDESMHTKMHDYVQMPPPMRSDLILASCNLITNGNNLGFMSSTSSFSATNNHDLSDASLELQLRPPCRPELCLKCGTSTPYNKLGSDMSDLSLSLTSRAHKTELRDVKPEHDDEGSQKNTRVVASDALKLVTLKHVKSEPLEGTFLEKALGTEALEKALVTEAFGNPKLAGSVNTIPCTRAIKTEPLTEPSLDYINMDPNSLAPVLHRTEAVEDASESTVSSLLSDSLVSDGRKQDDVVKMSVCTSAPMIGSAVVDKEQNSVSKSSIININKPACYDDMPSGNCVLQNENIIAAEASDSALDSLVSEDGKLCSDKEKCETASVMSEYHLKSVDSNCGEQLATNRLSEVDAKTYFTGDKLNSSENNASDEIYLECYRTGEEADRNEEKICVSTETQMVPCGNDTDLNNPLVALGVGSTTPKEGGDDDYEDGEVRDLTAGGSIEGSRQQNEEKQVRDKETADSTDSLDAPIMVQSSLDGKGKQVLNSDNVKHDPDKDMKSTSMQEPTVKQPTSMINSLTKITVKKGEENSSGTKLRSSRGSVKHSQDKHCSQAVNAIGADLPAKRSDLSKVGLDGAKHGRVINLNVSRDKGLRETKKSNITRSTLSHTERENLVDKSSMQIKANRQGNRVQSGKERSYKFENAMSQEQVLKCGSDTMSIRRAAGMRLGASCYDMDTVSDYMLQRYRNPPRSRSPRLERIPEFSLDDSVRNVSCGMSDGASKSSRLPFRRRSPGARVGRIQLGPQITGRHAISPPGRCIGRDSRDPFPFAREGKMSSALEDDMLDTRLLPHSRSRFERPESMSAQRGRSLSPVQYKAPALPLHRHYLESSPRSRFHSQRLSPSRRSPNSFSGVHCRSPPGIRFGRMRSPPQHPCYSEGMVVKRHGSPLHASEFINDARDIGAFREHDFPDHGMMLPRNIKRFDVNDPRDAEEYFEHLAHNRFRDLVGSEECTDDRHYDERHGLVQPLHEEFCVAETDEVGPRYYIEDGRSRPFRNCREVNEGILPDRGCPKDFDGPIRRRPGNIHRRLRGMGDQKVDHMYQGRQGWHDADLCDVRPKRRRF